MPKQWNEPQQNNRVKSTYQYSVKLFCGLYYKTAKTTNPSMQIKRKIRSTVFNFTKSQ